METIEIPEVNLPVAVAKFKAINRRAKKRGIPGIEYTIGKREQRMVPRYDFDSIWYSPTDVVPHWYVTLEYSTEEVVIGGYRPIATVEHEHSEPTIFTWPGCEMPDYMRDVGTSCSHCNKSRDRKRVFILQNVETGEHINVGSTCVRDFIGYDPSSIVWQLGFLRDITGLSEDDDDSRNRIKRDNRIDLFQMLPITVAIVEKVGWVSLSAADASSKLTPTAWLVSDWLDGVFRYRATKSIKQLIMEDDAFRKQCLDISKKVVETIINDMKVTNEYTRNLFVIARDGYCMPREFNLSVSMVNAAMREWEIREKRDQRAKELPPSDYIGEIGERITVDAKMTLKKSVGGAFGLTYLVKFVDNDDNVIVWFASREPEFNEGDGVTITGRVKDHREWNERRETILTRCKLVAG